MFSKKGTPRLLRQVANKPYATDADHDVPSLERSHQQRKSVSDLHREPDSDSDSERDVGKQGLEKRHVSPTRRPSHLPAKTTDDPKSDSESNGKESARWKPPASAARIRASGKRISGRSNNATSLSNLTAKSRAETVPQRAVSTEEDGLAARAESVIFSSQDSKKRARAGYGSKAPALKKPKLGSRANLDEGANKDNISFRQPRGRDQAPNDSNARVKKPAFANPKVAAGEQQFDSSQPGSSPPSAPSFRRPTGMAGAAVPTSTQTSALSNRSPPSSRARASSLFSLSSDDDDDDDDDSELPVLTLRRPNNALSTSPCPLCAEQVDDSFKTDFLIEKCHGGRMNLRLQQLFCKTHKERAAKKTWTDRNYPVIDWSKLHTRLRRHDQRIQDVLVGKIQSQYREELDRRLRSGTTKTTIQTWENDAETRTKAGYYGSRGEKVMTDHIVNTFGKELRRRAGSDKVIAAMGVSGGVTGYLQSVLVPEMALALIMEDSGCAEDEARKILAESSAIGETLNEAEEEKVPGGTARLNAYDIEDDYEDDKAVTLLN